MLYLEAEAAGFSGTGMGYFDDVGTLETLGLEISSSRFQDFYHFAIGKALRDDRLQ